MQFAYIAWEQSYSSRVRVRLGEKHTQANMIKVSAALLLLLGSCACDPLAKEVIRAMDEVIADHVAWDDWEEWSKIMEEVDTMTHNGAL